MYFKVIGTVVGTVAAVLASALAMIKYQPSQGMSFLEVREGKTFLNAASTAPYDYDFYQFMALFGKSYQTIAEMEQRYQTYQANVAYILDKN